MAKQDTKTVKKKSKRNWKDTIKGIDPIAWFFIIATIVAIGLLTYLVIKLSINVTEEQSKGHIYFDEELNYSIEIPKGWNGIRSNEDRKIELVYEMTGGVPLDLRYDALTEEIVPLTLITNPNEDKGKNKFITFALRGSDKEFSYLTDKVKLMDDFKAVLKESNFTDIEVESVAEYANTSMAGILIDGTAVFKGEKTYFYQYFEPVGTNILTVTYASNYKRGRDIEELNDILENLHFHDGGAMLPESVKDRLRDDFERRYKLGPYAEDVSKPEDKNEHDHEDEEETETEEETDKKEEDTSGEETKEDEKGE